MNHIKQLLALLRFQLGISPFIMILPLVFGTPYLLPFLGPSMLHDFHPTLGLVVQNQNMWLVGFFGILLLAPEVMGSGDANAAWSAGLEFLLTRPVDRRIVLRARSVVYYSLVLALPLAACLSAFESPVLRVTEFQKEAHQEVLDRMPGSIAEEKSNTITIPNGNTMVQGWRLWVFMCIAIGTQVLVYLVYPLRYRRFICWGAFAVIIFVPLATALVRIREGGSFSPKETLFFGFVAHQPLCWVGAIAALILVQLWCESRFSRMEQ